MIEVARDAAKVTRWREIPRLAAVALRSARKD